jgi:hypothetical protein
MPQRPTAEPPTATVIAFPGRPAPVPAPVPAGRLELALAGLEAAMAEQRAAVADWRASLGTLHAEIRRLSDAATTYGQSLEPLRSGVTGLGDAARRVVATLDRAV